MIDSTSVLLRKILQIALALLPWAGALFLHYWLEHGGIWDVAMPFRALISVLLLATGMGLSFLVYTRLARLRS